MKKLVSFCLAVLAVFMLASCGEQTADTNGTVDVAIPAMFFSDDEQASETLTAEQKKQGITKAVVHADGSVTYTFQRDAYEDFIDELHRTTAAGLDQIVHDDNAASIKKVTYNDDFSRLTFTVDREAFEGSFDGFACHGAYLAVAYYRAYAQMDNQCTVDIFDETTGDKIGSLEYPDALEADEATTAPEGMD